jgi:glycosyltransferase involved in cell wall biosynthesis
MTCTKVLIADENKGFGGAERHVLTLAHALNEANALDSIAARKNSWLALNTGELPLFPVGFRNEVDMLSVYSLYRHIKSRGINVLHCIGHRDLVAVALARNLPGAPPTVLVKAEHSYPDSSLSPLFRWAYGQCHAITSVSHSLQKEVSKAIEPKPGCLTEVIPNGIEALGPVQPIPPLDGRALRIGVLSPLRPGKGQADFLRAAARAQSQTDKALHFSLAGDGELKTELEGLAKELGLEVDFLGHVEDPVHYLNSLDVSVVPSHRETFSLVTLESLFCGRTVLAANSEGATELCQNEKSATLVPVGDVEALASEIVRFCEDAQQRTELAQAGAVEIRDRYSSRSMAKMYCDLYQRLLESN